MNYIIDWDAIKGIDIRDVLDDLDIRLTRTETFCCPAHDDTRPSAKIYHNATANNWYCFSCGEGGSAIDLVMHATGRDAREAAVYLGERFNVGLEEVRERDAFPDETYIDPRIAAKIFGRGGKSPFVPRTDAKTGKTVCLGKREAAGEVIRKCDKFLSNYMYLYQKLCAAYPYLREKIFEQYTQTCVDVTELRMRMERIVKNERELSRPRYHVLDIPEGLLEKIKMCPDAQAHITNTEELMDFYTAVSGKCSEYLTEQDELLRWGEKLFPSIGKDTLLKNRILVDRREAVADVEALKANVDALLEDFLYFSHDREDERAM